MLQDIKNGDLIITPTHIKKQILKELTKEKRILNIKFMTIKEFTDNYFGSYDEKALYYLIKKYNLKYGVAKEYLDNVFFNVTLLKPYYEELKAQNLIIENKLFREKLNNIFVIGYDSLDKYITDELEKYNTKFINIKAKNYIPKIYEFNKQTEEISFIANDIASKLVTKDINDFYLLNITEDYKDELIRIFEQYNLKINIENSKKIYSSETANIFLNNLINTRNIEQALSDTPKNDIYNKIIDILNKYNFVTEIDDTYINIIKEEIKNAKVPVKKFTNAINITSLDTVTFEEDKYYYILGFNQGMIPRIYHDDELIKDEERKKLGLNTSLEKLKNEKTHINKLIHSIKNLIITYKLQDNYQTYYPSSLIEELNLNVIKNPEIKLTKSHKFNQIKLAESLDNLIKYNEKNENLEKLYSTYPNILYQTYDNRFKNVLFEDIDTYLNGKLNLSYSNMNNYYLCAFRFYIQDILKLNPFEQTFMATIGSLFHECLSHMYDEDFNLEKLYNDFQKDKDFSAKEKFFLKKLYKNMEFIIDTIRWQESYSELDKALTEEKITIDKSSKLKINFKGIVDKIKYKEENGKKIAVITDYKTGNITSSLDNINYGLHLQLPVYVYLTQKKMYENFEVAGFYLQKILPSIDIDSDENEMIKKLRLEGYTISDEEIISKIDSNYSKSLVIKGMSKTNNGFSHYAKLINKEGIEKVTNLVDNKINEVIKNVEEGNFSINPKRIDGKIVGCEFCEFKDLCYRKEEDIINLKNTKFEEII
jgi:ATP-dependent helicase/DNAse subunit B